MCFALSIAPAAVDDDDDVLYFYGLHNSTVISVSVISFLFKTFSVLFSFCAR